MSIQRWNYYSDTGAQPMPDGEWVTYADHVAAVAAAAQRGREAVLTAMSGEIDTAFAAGLKAAREAVEAENKNPISRVTTDYDIGYRDGTNDTVRLHLRAIDALTTSGKEG